VRAGGAPVDTGIAAPPPGGEDDDLMRGRYFADAKTISALQRGGSNAVREGGAIFSPGLLPFALRVSR
jgi:hypothetical protein